MSAALVSVGFLACSLHVDGDVKVHGMPDAMVLVVVPGCSDAGEKLDASALDGLPIDAGAIIQWIEGSQCR